MGGYDGAAKAAIKAGMEQHGAVLVSSMWTGWVPPNSTATGDLDGSHFTISNIQFNGKESGPTMNELVKEPRKDLVNFMWLRCFNDCTPGTLLTYENCMK